MLNSIAVDLPLMRSAVLVSQFLQLYLKKRPCKLYQKSLSNTLALDEPKLSELEYVSVETSLKKSERHTHADRNTHTFTVTYTHKHTHIYNHTHTYEQHQNSFVRVCVCLCVYVCVGVCVGVCGGGNVCTFA